MLTDERVLPFLYHDHPAVRWRALHYFTDRAGTSPLTPDHLWRGLDQFGLGYDGRSFLSSLSYLPHTDASIDRLLGELAKAQDEEVLFALLAALRDVDLEALLKHRDRLLGCPQLTPPLREGLERRLAKAELSLDELWGQLMEYSVASHAKSRHQFDVGVFDALAESLARHGQQAAARALDYIQTPSRMDWAELYCVDVLERCRYRPALDRLIEEFVAADQEDDALHSACERAIPAVGGADAVAALRELFANQSWTIRLYSCGALGRLRDPSAEAALLDLLKDPRQQDVHGSVMVNLAALLPTGQAFDELYRRAREADYDRRDIDLKEEVFALATMAGTQIPEYNNWRRHADNRERRSRELLEDGSLLGAGLRRVLERLRESSFDKPGDPDRASHGAAERLDDEADWDSPDPLQHLPDPLSPYAPPVTATIRRDQSKVGRNDPCPCGSGKKYKKCCGG